MTGKLELLTTPDLPWDPRQPLRLSIAGVFFRNIDIDRWTVL